MKNINKRYDLVLNYINEAKGESNGEHIIESHRKIEDINKGVSRRDLLDYFKKGREVKEGERKELQIKEKLYNGEDWEEVQTSVIRLGTGDIVYDINMMHYISLDKRVSIFTDEELISMIENNLISEEEEHNILTQLGGLVSLYNIRVDGYKWYLTGEDALADIKSTIPKEGLEEFYSIELLKVFWDDTFESYIVKEFVTADEGKDFITKEVDISEYGKTLNFVNKEVSLGEDKVEEWLIVLNKVVKVEDGYMGDVEEVIYEWDDESSKWKVDQGIKGKDTE